MVQFNPIFFLWMLIGFHASIDQTTSALTLNPLERIAFKDRLTNIQSSIKQRIKNDATFLTESSATSTSKSISIIFPGAGGPDQFTAELESSIQSQLFNSQPDNNDKNIDIDITNNNHQVLVFDWSEHRGSLVTAALDSEAVGESVAESIWDQVNGYETCTLKYIHCIGISVGGFAGNACAQTMCKLREKLSLNERKDLYVRLTLLDPFCSRGFLGTDCSAYGATNFGLGVDFADQYLNTDDPVPTTNDPLPNCACIDVTGASERNDFELPEDETMHCWPLVYFARYGYEQSLRFAGKGDGDCLIYHGQNGAPVRGSIDQRK